MIPGPFLNSPKMLYTAGMHTFQDLGGDSFGSHLIHYLLEAEWTKKGGDKNSQTQSHCCLILERKESSPADCRLPSLFFYIYFLVKRDMHQIDFIMHLIFCRITDMSKVSMSSRPESGYENMDHFSLNVDHVAEMLRTIEFQTGEEWLD